jgi:hypothetical protein
VRVSLPASVPFATLHGTCEVCGRPFTWRAHGGRGRRRSYCGDECTTLAHDVERLSRAIEGLTLHPDAVPAGLLVYANTIAGLAAALRAKAPKAAPKVRGQLALLAAPKAPKGVRR